MKSKKLKLGQIDLKMCKDYDLIQAMDYDFKTKEVMNKGRGFAVTVVKIQGLTFLIPFRSYIPKKYQLKYKLRNSAKEGYVEGLDIGKTLILEDKSYLLNTTFRLRKVKLISSNVLVVEVYCSSSNSLYSSKKPDFMGF